MHNQTYRWLTFSSRKSLEELGGAILLNKFPDMGNEGFTLYECNKNLIEAKYTEKVLINEKIIDQLGNITTIPLESFVHINFLIREKYGSLELYNPPRRLLGLINCIGKITNYETAISQPTINIPKFIKFLEKEEIRLLVKTIKCKNITLSNDTQAEMVIRSTSDVRNDADKYFHNYSVASATISITSISKLSKLTISRSGHIKLTDCRNLINSGLLRKAVAASLL